MPIAPNPERCQLEIADAMVVKGKMTLFRHTNPDSTDGSVRLNCSKCGGVAIVTVKKEGSVYTAISSEVTGGPCILRALQN